jgi:hypothetical protein
MKRCLAGFAHGKAEVDPRSQTVAAMTQEECPDEDVRGLVAFYDHHPLLKK